MKPVTLKDFMALSARFGCEFKIEPNAIDNESVIMCAGPVRWHVCLFMGVDTEALSEAYYEMSLRLAATYPNKILEPLYGN